MPVDRDAEDAAGTFGVRIAALRPDAVIDLVCFTAAWAQAGRGGTKVPAGTAKSPRALRSKVPARGDQGTSGVMADTAAELCFTCVKHVT